MVACLGERAMRDHFQVVRETPSLKKEGERKMSREAGGRVRGRPACS